MVGLDLLPGSDAMSVRLDTSMVITGYTVRGDSTLANFKTKYILGSQADPIFGLASAEIVTQLRPSTVVLSFGTNPSIDTVILYLYLDEIKGKEQANMQVSAYEYADTISADSVYYSNMDITGKFRDEVLGTAMVEPGDTVIEIWIEDEEFRNKFRDADDSMLNSAVYLQQIMRGLYITCDDPVNGGMLASLDWSGGGHKLEFRYANDSSDSNVMNFLVSTPPTTINLFSHDYTGSGVESYITAGSTNDTMLFIESLGGVGSVIRFQGIEQWRDSMPVAIIKADLCIQMVDTSLTLQEGKYLPSVLELYLLKDGKRYNYDDFLYRQGNGLPPGGEYDEETGSYIFNLKIQVQSIIRGDIENLEMLLVVEDRNENISRAVLHGYSQNPFERMQLKILYTRY